MVLKKEIAFFAIIVIFALTISIFAFTMGSNDPFSLSTRLLALDGYIALSIAAIMTPFLKEITLFFKKSFVKVHHYFAATGLLLITLHPIVVAIQVLNLNVFLPNFDSLTLFFFFGGLEVLILIYVAFSAAFLRKKIVAYWRWFHALMYVALFIGLVHANLRGTEFQNIYIQIIFDGLFVGALTAFSLKRLQFYRLKKRIKTLKNGSANGANN